MKNIKFNITSIVTLSTGLLLGWLFFGGNDTMTENHDHSGGTTKTWTCSMHPQVKQDAAGKCPFCGMALIPLQQTSDNSNPNALTMSESAMKLANIQTIKVTSGTGESQIRLSGKIETDESRIKSQVLHIPGRIEKLYVDFTGQNIRLGQKIATIYSPELVTAQKELKEALRLADKYPNLVAAARRKFENWKLSPEQVKALEVSNEVQTRFDIIADISGVVTVKNVQVGDHLKQGDELFEVSDLSRVWVLFDAYEQDLKRIKTGNEIAFSVKAYPGESFKGKVEFIDQVVNPRTRTTSVRISVNNAAQRLKPEMLVEGIIKNGNGASEISIPKSAVLWTGKRSIVYRQLSEDGPGFQMIEVVLGNAIDDHYIIMEGLEEGDLIVVNGVFFIDAAAQLQGMQSMMNPEGGKKSHKHDHGTMEMENDQGIDHSQHQMNQPEVNISNELFEVSSEFRNQLRKVFEVYLPLKDALIETDVNSTKQKASPLMAAVNGVDMSLVKGNAHNEWVKDFLVLKLSTQAILDQSDVEKIRESLSPLSDQLYQTLKKYQVKTGGYRQFCPMAFDNKGAFWLSDSEEVLNPYFGDAMLTCGSIEEEMN